MVIKEFYKQRKDGINLYKVYSSDGVYIQKVGTTEVYVEAIDIESVPFEYVETGIAIEH